MRLNYYKIQGITLLEILLVMAISSAIIVFGIQQYNSYQNNLYQNQLRHNVDSLFQGLANYYRANCIEYQNTSGAAIKPGLIDPDVYAVPFPIDIDNDLATIQSITPGFLSGWPFQENPLVDGYVVQFNWTHPNLRYQKLSDGTTMPIGTIYLLTAQVAVHLSPMALKNANAYKQLLAADCLSDVGSTPGVVSPCTSASTGEYLVWERLPSFGSPSTTTDLWPGMPLVNQFLQMYTTYPMNTLTNKTTTNQGFWCNG